MMRMKTSREPWKPFSRQNSVALKRARDSNKAPYASGIVLTRSETGPNGIDIKLKTYQSTIDMYAGPMDVSTHDVRFDARPTTSTDST